jgi:aminoglycoside phosphotransferase (APT) family kinase protein
LDRSGVSGDFADGSDTASPDTDGYRLERWLERTQAAAGTKLGEFRRASNGFSAETLLASWSRPDFDRPVGIVIRFEQPGGEIFLDTDIVSQAETLRALFDKGIPVPELLGVEPDAAVLGRRFLVMKYSAGRTFPQNPNYHRAGWVRELSPQQRTVLWSNALGALGRINQLTAADGFGFLDRSHYGSSGLDQYLGWLRAWRNAALREQTHEVIDAAMRYLEANRPDSLPAAFVWGDSNPCNILFNPDLSVSALLDFEAAALGPAEIDLGWWFFLDRTRLGANVPLSGVPDRDVCIAIYEAALGRRVHDMEYFEILGGVRMALVIVRTVTRLIEAGRLPPQTDAAIDNPMVAALARLLGMNGGGMGDGFLEFVSAVTAYSRGDPATAGS